MPPCHCESRDFSQDTSSATLVDPWLENPSQSAKPPTGGTGWFSHQAGREYNGAMPGGLPSLNMTLRTNTLLSLLSLLSLLASSHCRPPHVWSSGSLRSGHTDKPLHLLQAGPPPDRARVDRQLRLHRPDPDSQDTGAPKLHCNTGQTAQVHQY